MSDESRSPPAPEAGCSTCPVYHAANLKKLGIGHSKATIKGLTHLVEAVREGKFDARVDLDKFQGNERLIMERAGTFFRRHLGHRLLIRHASAIGVIHKFDVTAKRNRRYTVIGDADLFPDKPRTKTQRKFFNPHPKQARNQEMTEFVEKN